MSSGPLGSDGGCYHGRLHDGGAGHLEPMPTFVREKRCGDTRTSQSRSQTTTNLKMTAGMSSRFQKMVLSRDRSEKDRKPIDRWRKAGLRNTACFE